MSKMSELDYEQRMAADQPRPTLSEAAQAVIDRWDSPNWTHDSIHTGELIFALREAVRDDALDEMQRLTETDYGEAEAAAAEAWADEYELIGTIDGTYAGRWMLAAFAENASAVWPEGTEVYVRRVAK